MKRLLIAFALTAIFQSVSAQRVRVFEHFTPAFAFGNNVLVPSVSYTQSLAFGETFGFRLNLGVRYSHYILKSTATLKSESSSNGGTLTVNKTLNSPSFNFVGGFEVGNRIVAAGVNLDLLGFNLGNAKGSDFASVDDLTIQPEGFEIIPRGFNFIGNQSGTLNNQLYVAVTPNPTLTIRGGLAYTQTTYESSYQLTPEKRVSYDTFRERNFRPFLALQFNFEK